MVVRVARGRSGFRKAEVDAHAPEFQVKRVATNGLIEGRLGQLQGFVSSIRKRRDGHEPFGSTHAGRGVQRIGVDGFAENVVHALFFERCVAEHSRVLLTPRRLGPRTGTRNYAQQHYQQGDRGHDQRGQPPAWRRSRGWPVLLA